MEIERRLKTLQAGTTVSRSEHLESLEARYESLTMYPKCGGALIKRLAKKSANGRERFLRLRQLPQVSLYTRDPQL
jgi:hypothetical protein